MLNKCEWSYSRDSRDSSRTRHKYQNMATDNDLWHCGLSILPRISSEAIDSFVFVENVVTETTIRGYIKLFLRIIFRKII